MRYAVELLSSFLTVTTICLSVVVVKHWRTSAVKSIKKKDPLTSEQWFVVGVFIGFIGQTLDNAYWLMAWSSRFINPGSIETAWLFDHGIIFNIPFRQIAGIIAAYCHVMAITKYNKDTQEIKKVVKISIFMGSLYSLSLILIA